MRILLTGASGFIGHAMALRLAEIFALENIQLICPPKHRHNLEESRFRSLREHGFDIVIHDLLQDELNLATLKPFDVLFHLAAFTETETESPLMRTNDVGTRRLLESLRPLLRDRRVIMTGSMASVDRERADDTPQNEDQPCVPRTEYGQTKLEAEKILRRIAASASFSWTIVRLPTVYGPGYRPNGMFGMLARGLRQGSLAVRLAWPGKISLAFRDDVIEALIGLVKENAGRDTLYHLGSTENPRFDELISQIATVIGAERNRIELPSMVWSLLRRALWFPGFMRVLPFSLHVAAWRASLLVNDGMVSDGAKLEKTIALRQTSLERGLRATYPTHARRSRVEPKTVSASVIVPCRNERGNIEDAVLRIPMMGSHTEIIFVEGHSHDGTLEECERMRAKYPHRNITVLIQDQSGKGDAVRKGFAHARNDLVMVQDADLTTPPELLPLFFSRAVETQDAFFMGTRFLEPMENGAMPFLNYLGNRFFTAVLGSMLDTQITDTLCGTKVMWRKDYIAIREAELSLGGADPFGDFDLIFGAAQLDLGILEIPVAYRSRRYGTTQIKRFRDGLTLLKLSLIGWRLLRGKQNRKR